MRIHSVAYDIRATSTLYKIFQSKSRPSISSTVITSTSSRQKSQKKSKNPNHSPPPTPPTRPNHHATRNLSPLSFTKHPSIHASNTALVFPPISADANSWVQTRPAPCSPVPPQRAVTVVSRDARPWLRCHVTKRCVAMRSSYLVKDVWWGGGGGGSYRVPSAVCATSGWAGRSGSGG